MKQDCSPQLDRHFLKIRRKRMIFPQFRFKGFKYISIDKDNRAVLVRGTQRQFLENISPEDDLRSRTFGTFVVKFLACARLSDSIVRTY